MHATKQTDWSRLEQVATSAGQWENFPFDSYPRHLHTMFLRVLNAIAVQIERRKKELPSPKFWVRISEQDDSSVTRKFVIQIPFVVY